MESTVTDFVRVLRNAEVRVSPAETMDAVRALELVGYGERERVRQVLAATLAKTIDDKILFDECFERFFACHDAAPDQETEPLPPAIDAARPDALHESALSELAALLVAGDAARLQLAIAAAGRAAGLGNMRIFTQRGLYTRRVLEALGWQELQEDILNLEQAPEGADPGRSTGLALKRQAERLRDRVKDHVEAQYLLFASSNARELRESVLRTARLTQLEKRDMQQINRLVRRIARRLSARYSQRKRTFKRGLLDVPRTLRGGVAHDGLMFEPRWRSVRRDRPSLIAVCDVSGSVRAHARFLLLFLYNLGDVLPRVRSFVFSNELAEVTPLFEENAPEVAILGVNKSAMKPVWDGKQFVPRLTLPLSLTADHRVIDGALATRFNVYLAQLLADMRRSML